MNRRLPDGNLPAEFSSFVGHRREQAELRALLSSHRVVTLTGVAGVGKTRLAVRVAAGAGRTYPHGVWLVELAGLTDRLLLPHAVADALGIDDRSGRDPTAALADHLAGRRLLLVLDNCEHLLPDCATLAATLVAAAPDLRVLATSREVLRLPDEYVHRVRPLPVADAVSSSAVTLFADRAAAVRPGFAVTAGNAELVARICRRLDGIPLAIELAAARLRTLSLDQLAARLDDVFGLLTTGNRAAQPRQQTLREAIGWSYELCTVPERLLWQRASVFAGRFDVAAAQQVCAGGALVAADVPAALAALADKSVLVAEQSDDGIRYRLLETVRRYGQSRALDRADLRARHVAYCLDLARRLCADWFGPRQPWWTTRMRAVHADLRAALAHCMSTPELVATGARLAAALDYFWYGCGEMHEGKLWLERALAAHPYPDADRMRALSAYAQLLILLGDAEEAVRTARECLALSPAHGDPVVEAQALLALGIGLTHLGDPACREVQEAAAEKAAALGLGHPMLAYTAFTVATRLLVVDGDPASAVQWLAMCRGICRAHGDRWWLANTLILSGLLALRQGDVDAALRYGREAIDGQRLLHNTHGTNSAVELVAWVAAARGQYRRAARLLGAADRRWRDLGGSPFATGVWVLARGGYEAAARTALGEAGFVAEYDRGGQLSLDETAAYAVADAPPRQRTRKAGGPGLTRREREVADLLVQGLANHEIAARLVVSPRTVETHVGNLLAKLGLSSRTEVAAWLARRSTDAALAGP